MTVSVEDIDRWNAGDVREVFHATRNRAEAAFEASNGIANLPAFGTWGGDASEAAKTAIGQTRWDLDAHGNEALAVAQAASKAADDVEQVKSDLAQLRCDADGMGMAIDPIGSTVEAGPGSAGADPMEIMLKQMQLQERLNAILAEGARVDAELAKAIDMAIGKEPIPNAGPPVGVPSVPPKSTNPKDVKRWWDSLTPTRREDLAHYRPVEIGNLEGVPSAIREQVNAARLPGEISKAQATVDALDAHHVGHPNPSQLYANEAAHNKLADLQQLQITLRNHPGTGLLLLDTTSNQKNVLAAVATGDVDNAKQVGVTVGGMTTNVRGSVDGMTGEIIAQHDQAVELRQLAGGVPNPDSVATIAWLGYEAPGMNLDVTDDAMAKAGAGPLNHFLQGVGATSNIPDQELTAFGHSYGSLTTSLALQEGGAPVDNVVLYGSPGGELANASQLGVAPGHAYFMDGVTDGVPTTIANMGSFGPPLSDVPGFTELSVNSGAGLPAPYGDGQWHERAYGHSEYPRFGDNGELRMSGYNMAAVLAGLPDDTIAPPQNLPPPTFPLGPRGFPVPNPDYHP
ncbi:alpha/beta hydrolase [Mycolicibacterium hodleri]|uniref:alpha/beta hydrolase n=1 Tax=Mycolicibacterium hodleri TaxID=49897 RepID=UPI001F275045|nr:alpha/beta hydrolase [Mycolicibacterium hodleri]